MMRKLVVLLLPPLLGACPEQEQKKLRFAQFQAPSGVPDPKTVRDEPIDQPGKVGFETVLVVPPTIEWEQLNRFLDSVSRQARSRSGFKNAPRAQFADIRVYNDEGRAGDPNGWVGQIQIQGDEEPKIDIRIPYPIGKFVGKAIAESPEYGTIRPKVESVDADAQVTVTYPFITLGEDAYMKKVDYGTAVHEFNSWALELFRKHKALKDLTFVGEHRGKELVRIRMTREQEAQINITKIEEDLAAFSGQFMAGQMYGQVSDAAVAAKVARERKRVYQIELGQLPPDQVVIDKSLK